MQDSAIEDNDVGEEDTAAIGEFKRVANELSKKMQERTNAMKLFEKHKETNRYFVQIQNVTLFEQALDLVSIAPRSFKTCAQSRFFYNKTLEKDAHVFSSSSIEVRIHRYLRRIHWNVETTSF